jgi:peptidyl-prolyl cis-trans isomerase D
MAKTSNASKYAVWILLGLLIIGLAGFGTNGLNSTVTSVGTVGSKSISTSVYFNTLRRVLQNEGVTFEQIQALQIDLQILQSLIATRAVENEADMAGLSLGDENIRSQILSVGAFQGLDGQFDRTAYTEALRRQDMTEAEFEASLRDEAARSILQSAVVGGLQMPSEYTSVLLDFAAQRRSFSWVELGEVDLQTPLAPPLQTDLTAYYNENQQQFMLPPTKRLTYVHLSPDALLDEIDVSDEELRTAYNAQADMFIQAERRLVERLVYVSEEAAAQAAAQLEAGGTSFENLVENRGLTLSDIDLGDVTFADLGSAGETIFATEPGTVIGPLPSDLGPALFRVNGVLPAQETSFEDAIPLLRQQIASGQARRQIEAQAEDLDDILAGGATLEQLATENGLTLGTLDWHMGIYEGIAAYQEFQEAAAALTDRDFPSIKALEDGGIFAIRLDEELDERPQPFEGAKEAVEQAWRAQQIQDQLAAQSQALIANLQTGASFQDQGLTAIDVQDVTRTEFSSGAPFDVLQTVFEMGQGDTQLIERPGSVVIIRLEAIAPPESSEQTAQLRSSIQNALDAALAQDILEIYTRDAIQRAQPQIDQRAVDAVHRNFN